MSRYKGEHKPLLEDTEGLLKNEQTNNNLLNRDFNYK